MPGTVTREQIVELRRRRLQVGVTNGVLAQDLGVRPPRLSQWETGKWRMPQHQYEAALKFIEDRETVVLADLLRMHWERG